jgi:glycosyltransferase involved in cell wall biosynthesis
VSVVIPVFNCAAYIRPAVESVLAQSDGDCEIIVVDDGSTDDTGMVLERYGSRIRVIRQPNLGVSAARNTGMHAAAGEFLAFLDADDWWFANKLSIQLAALRCFPAGAAVFSDFSIVDDQGVVRQERGARSEYRLLRQSPSLGWGQVFRQSTEVDPGDGGAPVRVYHGRIDATLFLGNFINTCSVMVRRDVARQIGGFDRSLRTQEDYDYWLRIARHHSFSYVDAPLVARRKRPGQLTRPDQIEEVARSSLQVVERVSPWIAEVVPPDVVRRRLAEKHRELGFVQLLAGRRFEARTSLRASMSRQPGDLRASLAWAATYLPWNGLKFLLSLARWARRRIRG